MRVFDEYLKLTGARSPVVVLDEAQNAPGWERFVRYLIECKRLKVLVTGSSSKLMSREYATVLTGRHVDVEVMPLSFKEYLRFRGIEVGDLLQVLRQRSVVRSYLEEYLEYGGFPEVALTKDRRVKEDLLRTYFTDVLTKDVAVRFGIRKFRVLESLAKVLVSNISRPISLRRVAKALGESLHTIERYTEYLEAAGLVYMLKKLSRKVREVGRAVRKVYVVDVGIHNKVGHKLSEWAGKVLENMVFTHLARKYRPNTELFYYRTSDGREVDFATVRNGVVTELIQVTYELREEDLDQYRREVGALVKASKELNCRKLTMITWEQEGVLREGDLEVRLVPLWKWLPTT